MNYFLVYIYLIPAIFCQSYIDYQNEDGTEVYDDYVFNPDAENGGNENGSGSVIQNQGNNQVIDNDDEDYSDNVDNGSGSENFIDTPEGTVKPDLNNNLNIGKL